MMMSNGCGPVVARREARLSSKPELEPESLAPVKVSEMPALVS